MTTRDVPRAWIAAAFLVAMTASAAAQPAVPQVREQAAGYYRRMLVDFEIAVLSDGTVPQTLMTNTTPEEVRALVARGHESLPLEVPGLGHLRKDGDGFAWIPVSYRVID